MDKEEAHDIASQYPEILEELNQLFELKLKEITRYKEETNFNETLN